MLRFHPLEADWGNPVVPVPLQQRIKFLLRAGGKIFFMYFGFRTQKQKNINNVLLIEVIKLSTYCNWNEISDPPTQEHTQLQEISKVNWNYFLD